MAEPKFHFVLLAIGEILKFNKSIDAQKIQNFIYKDENFRIRVPLSECRLALQLMESSGFIFKSKVNQYKKVL